MATNNNNNNIEALKGTWDYVCYLFIYLFKIINNLLFKVNGENFDELMKELGVNQEIRAIAKTVKPRVTIAEKEGKWSLKSENTYKTTTVQFTPGIEFEEVSPDGKQITV